VWKDDGWLYLEQGGVVPAVEVPSPDPSSVLRPRGSSRTDFSKARELPMEFQWLRTPYPERLFTLTGKALRLRGRESIGSWFEQSLVARRQEDFHFHSETSLAFDPTEYRHVAGLTYYYNRFKFHAVAVTWHEKHGRALTMLSCPGDYPDGRLTFALGEPIALPPKGVVGLAADVDHGELQFRYDTGEGWRMVGPILDASVISDEGGRGAHGSFTGAFIGMFAFDTAGTATPADFSYFEYSPR
jgi:xylan 1,4-beta-xylosidase